MSVWNRSQRNISNNCGLIFKICDINSDYRLKLNQVGLKSQRNKFSNRQRKSILAMISEINFETKRRVAASHQCHYSSFPSYTSTHLNFQELMYSFAVYKFDPKRVDGSISYPRSYPPNVWDISACDIITELQDIRRLTKKENIQGKIQSISEFTAAHNFIVNAFLSVGFSPSNFSVREKC